eukprot:5795851-Lingulodinium_polyedra.AAC.1
MKQHPASTYVGRCIVLGAIVAGSEAWVFASSRYSCIYWCRCRILDYDDDNSVGNIQIVRPFRSIPCHDMFANHYEHAIAHDGGVMVRGYACKWDSIGTAHIRSPE